MEVHLGPIYAPWCMGRPSPVAPVAWPPFRMGDCDDLDSIIELAVHEEEGEPIEETTTRAPELRPGSRRLQHAGHGVVQLTEEGSRRARVPLLVPGLRGARVGDGFRMEVDPLACHQPPWIARRAWLHGMARTCP